MEHKHDPTEIEEARANLEEARELQREYGDCDPTTGEEVEAVERLQELCGSLCFFCSLTGQLTGAECLDQAEAYLRKLD